jgi:hypothetical protein
MYAGEYTDSIGRRVNARFITPKTNRDGYIKYRAALNGKHVRYSAHRLVAMAFIPNPNSSETINHINGIKSDNRVDNLEWATRAENIIHAVKTNLFKTKITEFDVKNIRHLVFNGFYSQRKLAPIYGVTQSLISTIVSKKRWAHVKD